jgi:hypothetical protein
MLMEPLESRRLLAGPALFDTPVVLPADASGNGYVIPAATVGDKVFFRAGPGALDVYGAALGQVTKITLASQQYDETAVAVGDSRNDGGTRVSARRLLPLG